MTDMLKRFTDMKKDAKERCIRVTDDQICQLVLASAVAEARRGLRDTLREIHNTLEYKL